MWQRMPMDVRPRFLTAFTALQRALIRQKTTYETCTDLRLRSKSSSSTLTTHHNDNYTCKAHYPADKYRLLNILKSYTKTQQITKSSRQYLLQYPVLSYDWKVDDIVPLLQSFMMLNDFTRAKEFVHHVAPNMRRIESFYRMISLCMHNGYAPLALEIFQAAKTQLQHVDAVLFTGVIHSCACGNISHVHKALTLYDEMKNSNVHPTYRTYGAILLAHARLSDWVSIDSLLAKFQSRSSSIEKSKVFSCGILNCYYQNCYVAASRLFMTMLGSGLMPTKHQAWIASLNSCGKAGNVKALNAASNAIASRKVSDVAVICTLITAYGYANQCDDALSLFHRARQSLTESSVVVYNGTLTACVRSRRCEAIPSILECMEQDHVNWDSITLLVLLQACAIEKNIDQAHRYWTLATQKFKIPYDCRLYVKRMRVYLAAGDYGQVLHCWRKDTYCRSHAKSYKILNALLDACVQLSDAPSAREILSEFEKEKQSISVFSHNRYLNVLTASQNGEEAYKYLKDYLCVEMHPTIFSFVCVMKHFYKKKEYEMCRKVYEMYCAQCEGNALLREFSESAIIVYAARAASGAEAHEELVGMYRKAGEGDLSLAVRIAIAQCVLDSCKQRNDWKTAVSMYDHLYTRLDQKCNLQFYGQVIQIVASAGEIDAALDVNDGEWYRAQRSDAEESIEK